MDKSLYEKLKEYAKGDHLAMHMPGHKRNEKFLKGFPVDIDITEIDGFDNLHDMQGVLLDTAELAAKIYGATMCLSLIHILHMAQRRFDGQIKDNLCYILTEKRFKAVKNSLPIYQK